ncbi:hypothetical protein HRbin11_01939 [bacterium HR11]|nr:hypothetical protein HRbin11_01939 [bacterium HR11]
MALLRLRKEESHRPPADSFPKSFFKVHPVDLGVLLFLIVGFPVSLVLLPSLLSLLLLLTVITGWVAWKRTR